jgi:hypothetical protein
MKNTEWRQAIEDYCIKELFVRSRFWYKISLENEVLERFHDEFPPEYFTVLERSRRPTWAIHFDRVKAEWTEKGFTVSDREILYWLPPHGSVYKANGKIDYELVKRNDAIKLANDILKQLEISLKVNEELLGN